ncbi:MAG TPA: hypothetical protein GX004_03910 [Firmicutes bacterium]|jgi:hypothetical protein|nr:hypothetical protein [Bacillota bacterium]
MEENRLLNTGIIPLMILGNREKHYFELDENAHLNYYLDKEGNGCWTSISENILQRKISGFDTAIDKLGNMHLLGYDRGGGISYLRLPPDTPKKPELLLKEEGKQICHLSFCTDNADRLHVLYLAISSEKKMWWLFYLRQENGRWLEKAVMDFGYFQLEQYGIIFSDCLNSLFLLHRLYDDNGYSLALRSFNNEKNLPGQTIFLGERDHYCFFPDALAAPDNSLHISWISRKNNIMFINYARRSPQGKWENHLCTEISQGSAPFAPLYFAKDVLLLTWQNNNMLFCLISRDGGDSWKWGTKVELDDTYQLIRFRSKPRLLNDPTWRGNYTFSPACPPETYMQPEVLLKSQPEKDGVSEELEMLDLLSSRLLTGYDNLQASNAFFKQKIAHQKKELAELYSINLAKTKTLEEKLTSKNIEIKKMKSVFQNTIDELKAKISREREELASANHELQQEIKALQEEIEKRGKTNLLLTRELTRMKEEINLIKKENEHLQKKSINYYLQKLMKKNRD